MPDPESGREYFIQSTNEPLGPGVSSPLGEDQRDWVWWGLRREVLSGETLVASGPLSVTPRCKCSFPCPVVLTPQGQDEAGKWDPEQNRKGVLNPAVPFGQPLGDGGVRCLPTQDCVYLPPPASSSRVLSQRARTDALSQPQRKIRWGGSRLLLPFGKRTSPGLGRCPRVMLKWGEGAGAESSHGSEFLAPEHRAPLLSPELREAVMLARTDPLSLGLLRLPPAPPPLSRVWASLWPPPPSLPQCLSEDHARV